jgi:hypothetical protein
LAATTSSAGHRTTPATSRLFPLAGGNGGEKTPEIHDRLALPISGPTLDHTEWGKDPGLEPSFNPVLDRIQYLAENGLTSLMVLHDFLSKRLTPL